MISTNVSPAAIAFFSKIHFLQNGKISCFSHDRHWKESEFGSVKDTGSEWRVGAIRGSPQRPSREPVSSVWSHFPYRSHGPRVQAGQAAVFALEVLALDDLGQTPTDSGFLVLQCDRMFVHSLLFTYSFIFELDGGFYLGRSLVSRICSQKKNSASLGSHW